MANSSKITSAGEAIMQECCKAWGCTRARGAPDMRTVPGTHRGTGCLLLWLRLIRFVGLVGEGITPAQQGLRDCRVLSLGQACVVGPDSALQGSV